MDLKGYVNGRIVGRPDALVGGVKRKNVFGEKRNHKNRKKTRKIFRREWREGGGRKRERRPRLSKRSLSLPPPVAPFFYFSSLCFEPLFLLFDFFFFLRTCRV